ncbi:MAG: PRC-barrel domain-containing protein [Acidobacteria bacterium]|nr:PRC-barrel domain-containing protein [Acidobacteriota bacterium]
MSALTRGLGEALDHPYPHLRHVDADEFADQVVDFDEMNVESPTGERLGEVEGFVVDSASGRPYYIAVDSGGWFKSRLFLLPVGHAQFDRDRKVLVADVTKDRVERFPGFDKDAFQEFDETQINRFTDETSRACNVTGPGSYSAGALPPWERPDFRSPEWWGSTDFAGGRRERLIRDNDPIGQAHAPEPSPYPGGRAQPGDVIGLETGGEQTHVGETAEDENKRRRDAEDEAAKARH